MDTQINDPAAAHAGMAQRLRQLDERRRALANFKRLSAYAVLALIALFGWRLYALGQDMAKDKDAYARSLQAAAAERFSDDLEALKQEAEARLIPIVKAECQAQFDKRLPQWEGRLHNLRNECEALLLRHLEGMIAGAFADIEKDVHGQLTPDQAAALHARLEKMQERLAESFSAHLEQTFLRLEPRFEKLNDQLLAISQGPESAGLTHETAERQAVCALLDLLKCELDPESGARPAAGARP